MSDSDTKPVKDLRVICTETACKQIIFDDLRSMQKDLTGDFWKNLNSEEFKQYCPLQLNDRITCLDGLSDEFKNEVRIAVRFYNRKAKEFEKVGFKPWDPNSRVYLLESDIP